MSTALVYLVLGVALLLGALLPRSTARHVVSAPIVLTGVGALVGLLPLPFSLDPVDHRTILTHLTELCVIVALTGVGLALDRPLTRARETWRRWGATWRLLLLAMPLTIAATALFGWWVAGLAPAAALLLASALAPTDPVLAADIQVEGPTTADPDEDLEVHDEEDEVRFALTSEAGLNDGLAFPFVYAAILLASKGAVQEWGLRWVSYELITRTVLGVAAGVAVGWLLAKVAFRAPRRIRAAHLGDPIIIIAAPMVSYGVGELVHGWGFVSAFVCALTMRAADRGHAYHEHMHEVVERLEQLLTLVVLLLLGAALTRGLLGSLTLGGALVGVALVFVIRPVTAWLSLGRSRSPDFVIDGNLGPKERVVTAFFGVRGVSSIFYLGYAAGETPFAQERELWSILAFTIVLSVVVHGLTASPVMSWLESSRPRSDAGRAASGET